jgi:putative transposase
VSVVVLEDIRDIRKRIRYSKALNGRLNRWGFRRLQSILEYKARLVGLRVVYVDPRGTSSLCLTCGEKLSPNGHRMVRCPKCGLEEDRDVLAVRNLLRRYQMDVGSSPVRPESPPMKRGGKT